MLRGVYPERNTGILRCAQNDRRRAQHDDNGFLISLLNDEELQLYDPYYQLFAVPVPIPDLVIYLKARSETLNERIAKNNTDGARNERRNERRDFQPNRMMREDATEQLIAKR